MYLVDQVEHGRSSPRISSSQKAKHIGRVVYTLDSQAADPPNTCGHSVEENGTFRVGLTNISGLSSTTSPDEGDRTARGAVCELVVGITIVLALGKIALGDALTLQLCSVFIDSKIRVGKVCDGKANSLRWCRSSERS